MRPVPGVPGTYWERTETGTTLVSVPDPEWDKLPPEEQRSITQRMLKCLDLAQHLDRVTALRDEFTKIAGEEPRSSGTKLTEGEPEREMDRKMEEQQDDPLIGDFNLDEKYRARIRNSNTPKALADLKAAGIDPKGQQPVVHILGGGAYSGKTTTELIRSLAELPDAVVINTDIFIEGIPEYQIMKKSDPFGATRRAHGEACDMAKEATTRAVQYRQNLILDKVSGDPLKLRADMEAFKRAGYWVELRFVDRPLEVALPGMVTRFEKTGQWVPASNVERGHFGAAAAFHQNKDFADRAILRMAAAGEQHQLVYSQGRKREGM
jgi:predicted ABC-type ATPase